MIPLFYFITVSVVMLAIGLAGIASDRHLIVIVLGVELILVASIISLVGFFTYSQPQNTDAIAMLLALFVVAAVEVIAVITFYVHMKSMNVDFDVTKLSRLKW
ncbi:MAG: NADH-quinone oxidoreductase subunit K [Candidatus Micrarchaeota archaeon]|nr:NADH-quinone oxidoreductase subunit K [Candidatus Micrarchaeota archaeon]